MLLRDDDGENYDAEMMICLWGGVSSASNMMELHNHCWIRDYMLYGNRVNIFGKIIGIYMYISTDGLLIGI